MLSFQQLDVYQRSTSFVTIGLGVAATLPRGHSSLADQLRRAAFSILLNIAEGAGRMSRAEASHHYAIARGSAMECAAILDVARLIGSIDEGRHREAIELLERVVAMLTKMSR